MSVDPSEDLPCRELVELTTEHLEGALDRETEQRVLEHLATCEGCEDHLDQVRTTRALAGALPAEPVPADLTARLLAAYRDRAEP